MQFRDYRVLLRLIFPKRPSIKGFPGHSFKGIENRVFCWCSIGLTLKFSPYYDEDVAFIVFYLVGVERGNHQSATFIFVGITATGSHGRESLERKRRR